MKLATTVIGLCLTQLSSCQIAPSKGHYDVPGLGANKQALLDSGGTTQDMAIAMVETEDLTADYPLGDGKTEDAAAFGIFKQNWYTLRNASQEFAGQSASDYQNGAALNENLAKDIQALHDSQDSLGFDNWAAAQRNGADGIENTNTQDIQNYKAIVEWIKGQIESDVRYQTDDTRFWVGPTALTRLRSRMLLS